MDAPSLPSEPYPVVLVLHGNDPLAIQRAVAREVEALKQDPVGGACADMNIIRLDVRQVSEDDLRQAAFALPFLAARRLVIATNPLAKANTDAGRKRFQALLDQLPETTTLVMVIEDEYARGKWQSLHENHWLRRWLAKAGPRGRLEVCALPSAREMPDWIRREAARQGGKFSPEAARSLASHVDNNTQIAALEIEKLLTYVDYQRAVEAEDVEALTAQQGQADVFEMVDAIASGNPRTALKHLHRLLEEQEPPQLFGMIVRQFRLLIQARELMDERRANEIQSELRLHSFVAEKLTQQARRFSMAQLEATYHRLLEMDEAMKTSQMPAPLAMDTFIAELASG